MNMDGVFHFGATPFGGGVIGRLPGKGFAEMELGGKGPAGGVAVAPAGEPNGPCRTIGVRTGGRINGEI